MKKRTTFVVAAAFVAALLVSTADAADFFGLSISPYGIGVSSAGHSGAFNLNIGGYAPYGRPIYDRPYYGYGGGYVYDVAPPDYRWTTGPSRYGGYGSYRGGWTGPPRYNPSSNSGWTGPPRR